MSDATELAQANRARLSTFCGCTREVKILGRRYLAQMPDGTTRSFLLCGKDKDGVYIYQEEPVELPAELQRALDGEARLRGEIMALRYDHESILAENARLRRKLEKRSWLSRFREKVGAA